MKEKLDENRKYHILYAVGTLSESSGVTAVIMNCIRHMDSDKFCVDVAAHKPVPASLEEEIKARGGRVFVLPGLSLTGAFRISGKIRSLLSGAGMPYDILHVHAPNLAALYFYAARRDQVPVRIAHSHNTKFSDSFLRSIRNYILTRPVCFLATHCIACSEKAGEFLFGPRVMNRGDVLILPNGIDTDRFRYRPEVRSQVRDALSLPGTVLVLGHIGRFDEQKNHSFLLDVFASVCRRRPDSVLMLVGDGPLLDQTKHKAEDLGLRDKILFLGRRSDTDRLLQAMDIFVMPSRYEGLPLAGVEAQAAGLPCLFSGRITRELQLTDRVEFLPTESGAEVWAEAALRSADNFVREDRSSQVAGAGYDVRQSAGMLAGWYRCWAKKEY